MIHTLLKPAVVVVCWIFIAIGNPISAITLPDIIGNGMVLKQKSQVALWGWDKADTDVTVKTEWNGKEYRTRADKDGLWRVYVQTPKAGGPYDISIKGTGTIHLSDILIGEVWFTSGQSNVGWSFAEEKDGLKYIENIDDDKVRLFHVPRTVQEEESKQFGRTTTWKKSNARNLKNFSAMSYYFAARLQKELNVPVGIISASWAGTGIESWLPYNLQDFDAELRKAINRWENWSASRIQDSIQYELSLDTWRKDSLNGIVKDKVRIPKSVHMMKRPHCKPGSLYNGMIAPCVPYSISGLIWYQGENSIEWAEEYEYQLEKLIDGWRSSWKTDFPVIVGQLTNFNYPSAPRAAVVRDAQLNAGKKKDTYVICTIDIGDTHDVHPVDKKPFGKRFADMVLNKVYGRTQFPADYPVADKAERKGDEIIISFRNSKGLHIKDGKLNDIVIWGDDNKKVPASATIKNNKLIVSDAGTKKPTGVSYAVDNDVKANLYNQYGLPAFPFIITLKD